MQEGNSDIVLIYFVGTIGMMLLAGGLLFFFTAYQKRLLKKQLELNQVKQDQQKEILRNTIQAQEKERKRIAQDLHDEVGAMLSVVKLNVAMIERHSKEKANTLAVETKTYLDDVIMQVRGISRSLLPPSLEKLGLYQALEELANWVNKSDHLKIECWNKGETLRFDHEKELAIFRVSQEVINNAIKHSEAQKIFVKIRYTVKSISVIIHDNGKGFNQTEKMRTGLGLRNLESRMEMINACFKIKSKSGKGTTAIIHLAL